MSRDLPTAASKVNVTFARATAHDVPAIAAVINAAARNLTLGFGQGYWSTETSERNTLNGVLSSYVLLARSEGSLMGTLRLATKKPWAIDPSYFAPVRRPLYLVDMAVGPSWQRQGVGRLLLDEAGRIASAWPAGAIWLDAFDAPAGAGPFYAKCGYREVGRVVYRTVPLIYFERLAPTRPS